MQRSVLCLAAALVATGGLAISGRGAKQSAMMADAAQAFLGTLKPEQRARAVFSFQDAERLNYHFTPVPRKGVPLKEMDETQRKAALDLLRVSVSKSGFEKAGVVRELEVILRSVEQGRGPMRDPELYFFSVFGEPSASGTWGWRYEGHHCALNWTVVRGKAVASSPQFYGSNPAEVRVDVANAPGRGTRVLAAEEDLARQLLQSLTDEQRRIAILDPKAPADILTRENARVTMLEDKGLPYSRLEGDQKKLFNRLIEEYARRQPADLAKERLSKIRRAGMDEIKFAWMGSTDRNMGHYYRVQGKTFLIEYDNTQNNANHIHAVWRDFAGDWGLDLLAMHYRAEPHRVAAK